ncbi:MAG: hypothetical protein ACRDWH_09370, partial [Acidimicrobiia bacterium]
NHPGVRAVTPEGDLISAEGIKIAHPDGATPAMVEAAAVDLDRAERELARVGSRFNTLKRQFDSARRSERKALETLESLEARLAGVTEALGRSTRTGADLQAELIRLEERQQALTTAISGRREQIRRLLATIEALQGEEAERQRLLDEWASRRRQAAIEREHARAAWQQAASHASAAGERRTLIEARRQVVADELSNGDRRPVSPESLVRLATIEQLARRAISELRSHVDAIRDRQQENRAAARSVGEELSRVRQRHEILETELDAYRQRLSALAIEQTEARVRREAVVEGLRREIDASEEQALAEPRPEVDEGGSLQDLLTTRRAELRRMGPVNPLASEEYRQLSERYEFMTSQLADLEKSRAELKKVMKALDDEIEGRFRAAFDEVAAAYQDNFSVMFPGGRGRIRLSDPDQPLTSWV